MVEALERQVGQARRRLLVASLLGKLAWCWFVALWAAALLIGVGKFWTPIGGQAWTWGWLATALVGGLAASLGWTWARRQSALEAAVEIDRRFGLKERVSSTLALDGEHLETEIGQALLRDADARIRQVNVADKFRLRPDRRALLPLLPAALALALAAFAPLRTREAPAQTTGGEAAQARQSTRQLVKRLEARRKEASERGLQELDPLLAKLEDGAKKLSVTSENDRQKTLLELGDLVKDVEKRRRELAGSADLKAQLAHLENLQNGPAEKFGQALEHGDFEKAVDELGKLQHELAAGKLDPDAQKALAEQLNQLQQAVAEKIAAHEKMRRELERQIEAQRRAGNLAQADRLQQQLDKLAAQKPQMAKLGQMCEKLERAGKCMGNGQCEQAAAALAQLGQEMEGWQVDLQEMEMLEGALDQVAQCKKSMACKQCSGQGCKACQGGDWQQHDGPLNDPFARRDAGKGIGVGLGPGLGAETDPEGRFYDSSVKQQPGKGAAKVVGEADGPNRKGRVQEAIQTEFSEARQNATDALGEQRLPREYRDHAKTYFDALREGTR